jgi:aminopeptidase N
VTTASPPIRTPDGATGSVGIGDPYYPDSGNGGYEVDAYDIVLSYDPVSNALSAQTTVTGTVTESSRLGRFNLDLQPTMKVSTVTVNGSAAGFQHKGAELMVTPALGLEPGARFATVVNYSGRPDRIPGGTGDLGDGGWYRTESGGAVAIGEPFSASAWYPVNEHPSDPAAFQVTATVPSKWSVISNGVPVTTSLPAAPAGSKVFRWRQTKPVTSYETTIYIDTFTTVTATTANGLPIISAFAPSKDVAKYKRLAADTPKIVQMLSQHFGAYPFQSAGGIYTGQDISFALETATRPVFADWVDTDTIVHELTHQWFGDYVVVKRWSDICLNECFASYGPWLWHQDIDNTDLDAAWTDEMGQYADDPSFWSEPLVDMGPGNEFTNVYRRGPIAIHALRKVMGEKAFDQLLRGWPATYGGKAASFADFISYVNKTAGKNLTAFINAWFKGTTAPPAAFLHPGGL